MKDFTSYGLIGCALLAALSTGAAADTIKFQDNFNGSSIGSAWTVGALGNSTESGGKLNLTSSSGWVQMGTTPSADLNFFANKLTFSTSMAVTTDRAGTPDYSTTFFVVSSGNIGSSNWGIEANVDDAITLIVRSNVDGDAFYMYDKQNATGLPAIWGGAGTPLVNSLKLYGVNTGYRVAGFDLTLDGTDYTLDLHWSNINSPTDITNVSYTGAHGLSAADWGNGASSIGLATYNGGSQMTAAFDSVTVTQQDAVPEPAAFGLLGLGCLALLRRR